MKFHETEELTMQAVIDYYNDDMQSFFNCLHPDTVILSISVGQLVRGKDEIIKNFANNGKANIYYELGDIHCSAERIEAKSCFVVLDCVITTIFPGQTVETVNQRISVVWKYIEEKNIAKERVPKEGWYALHIHISLAQKVKKKLENYAHVSEAIMKERLAVKEKEKIIFRDVNLCVHYVIKSQIVWLETRNRQVVAVMGDGSEIIMKNKMIELEEQLGDKYIRISRKNIVNIDYAMKVNNYQLFLIDGTILHIPHENYGAIKREIEARITKTDNKE